MTEVAPGVALGHGRYALERLLGAGGMATVWLATDRRLERQVAIKVLSDALAVDDAYTQRFEREARLAARLSHPHLVTVYDFGSEHRPYLVMEHVQGPTLGELLDDDGELREVEPLRLARALMGALDHIHRAGIVHRDVKPSNVLMGDGERIRLTDFGIAQPENGSRLTQTGQVMGTLRYLAPEVKAGGRSTPRSDMFASGVLLEAVLARRPHAAVGRLVCRLCDPNPEHRPSSAGEALAALADPGPTRRPERGCAPLRGGRITSARPPAAPDHMAPTSRHRVNPRPRPARVALAVAGAAAMVGTIALLSMGGGGSAGAGAPRSAAPPPGAGLSSQLDGIERTVRQGGR